jgi:hypothetical protein
MNVTVQRIATVENSVSQVFSSINVIIHCLKQAAALNGVRYEALAIHPGTRENTIQHGYSRHLRWKNLDISGILGLFQVPFFSPRPPPEPFREI